MGDGVFNIGKGRVVEYYNRVENNDPAASELNVMLGVGAITDATLIDLDSYTAVIADAGFTEATFTNYARKQLSDSELGALPVPDDTNDRYEVAIPDQTWTAAGGTLDNTLTRLIIGYDPLGTDVDANIIPLTFHDFAITTNGGDLTADVGVTPGSGFFRAA